MTDYVIGCPLLDTPTHLGKPDRLGERFGSMNTRYFARYVNGDLAAPESCILPS